MISIYMLLSNFYSFAMQKGFILTSSLTVVEEAFRTFSVLYHQSRLVSVPWGCYRTEEASRMTGETSSRNRKSPVAFDPALRITMTWVTENLYQHIQSFPFSERNDNGLWKCSVNKSKSVQNLGYVKGAICKNQPPVEILLQAHRMQHITTNCCLL